MMRMTRSVLVLVAALLMLSTAGTAAVFGTSFTVYDNDTAQLEEFRWLPNSSVKEPIIGGEYAVQLWGGGERLYERSFSVSFEPVFASTGNTSTNSTGNASAPGQRSQYFFYRLPYRPAAERFMVVHGEQALINITIPDRICRPDGDCPVYCRQQGREDADCEPRETSTGVPVLVIVGGLLVLAGVAVFLWSRREDDGQDEATGGQLPRRPPRSARGG